MNIFLLLQTPLRKRLFQQWLSLGNHLVVRHLEVSFRGHFNCILPADLSLHCFACPWELYGDTHECCLTQYGPSSLGLIVDFFHTELFTYDLLTAIAGHGETLAVLPTSNEKKKTKQVVDSPDFPQKHMINASWGFKICFGVFEELK